MPEVIVLTAFEALPVKETRNLDIIPVALQYTAPFSSASATVPRPCALAAA